MDINKNVELKYSFEWIKVSFNLFRQSPFHFIVLGIAATLFGLVPLLGSFMSPLFTAKFANLTAMVEEKIQIQFSSVFHKLFANKSVIKLGLLNLIFAAIILLAKFFIEKTFISGGAADITSILVAVLVMLLFCTFGILSQMAMWLSPLICADNPEIKVFAAMLLSLKASLYNIVTLFLYGVLGAIFTVISLIPLGLGLLIWLPIANITVYFIYKSVFIRAEGVKYRID